MSDTWFLTGALGCIGSWCVRGVLERGDVPVVFDKGGDPYRIRDIVGDEALERVRFVQGDLTDGAAVRAALEESGARRIVHLAGLQVPFCKADPPLGGAVNVVGTLNVFEAAKALGIPRLAYASSAAVYGPAEDDAPPPDERAALEPLTHYGVYKRANEGNALVYWRDDGISSAGLRPLTVYGVGRDQGLTSAPTSAMKAAVLGRPFTIGFGGSTDFLYAGDCAEAFLAAAEGGPEGAKSYNLHGETATLESVVELIRAAVPGAELSIDGAPIPFPPELDGGGLRADYPGLTRTALADGVAATLALFRELSDAGRLSTRDLEA